MTVLNAVLFTLIGLAGGIVVGTGLVALLSVLGIVPRLAQLSRTQSFMRHYQWALVFGAVFWTWTGLREVELYQFKDVVVVYGLLAGIFVGMLAAALAEVLNVFPILAKRINMVDQLVWLLMAMVLGKVLGSLFHWVLFAPAPS